MSHVEVSGEVPVISFRSDGIQPPSDLFMTRNDALFITSYNSVVGLTVHVRYTMLRADGVVIVGNLDTHVPNSDRSAKTTVQFLGEGFLLSAAVFLGSGAAARGQCYVQVGVCRGVDAARLVHRIIMQGYVGTAINLAWPGSRLETPTEGNGNVRSFAGTDPAAGQESAETVPTGARWKVLTFRIVFVTSATVANRFVDFKMTPGGSINSFVGGAPAAVAASSTIRHNFAAGTPWYAAPELDNFISPIPIEAKLPAASTFGTSTTSLQAGDNFAAPNITIEEWIEP